MNNLLIAIAVFIITVVGALFAIPYFVDWNSYRSVFEEEASRVVGREVQVDGDVTLHLLPIPSFRLEKVRIADASGTLTEPFFRTESLSIKLSIPPMVRGIVEANEIEFQRPMLRLALDKKDGWNWQGFAQALGSAAYMPANVTLTSLKISNGVLALHGPDGAERMRLEGLNGELSAPALEGPYRFRGVFTSGGADREIRLATATPENDGSVRLRASLRLMDSGSTYVLDARVADLMGKPRLEGDLTARLPIAGLLQPLPRGSVQPQKASALEDEPRLDRSDAAFELKAAVKADAAGALLSDLALTFEQEGRPQLVSGRMRANWRQALALDMSLTSHWLDLDRIAGAAEGAGPIESIAKFAGRLRGLLPGEGRSRASFAIDQAQLGKETIGPVRLSLARAADRLEVEEFRVGIPGGSRGELKGTISGPQDALAFDGSVSLRGTSVVRFVGWATGNTVPIDAKGDGAFGVRAQLNVGAGRVMARELIGDLSGTTLRGSGQYRWEGRPEVSLALEGPQIDARAFVPLGSGLPDMFEFIMHGPAAKQTAARGPGASKAGARGGQTDVVLRINAGQLVTAARTYRDLQAAMELKGGHLRQLLLRLSGDDGYSLELEGSVDDAASRPKGSLRGLIVAETVAGISPLVELLGMPEAFRPTEERAQVMVPLRLAGSMTFGNRTATSADVVLDGEANGAAVKLNARFDGGSSGWRSGNADVTATVESSDGARVAGLLIADATPARSANKGAGRILIKAGGVPSEGLTTLATLESGEVGLAFRGQVTAAESGTKTTGNLEIRAGDGTRLAALAGLAPPLRLDGLPISARLKLALGEGTIGIDKLALQIGGSKVGGQITLSPAGDRRRIEANLDADEVTVAKLLGPLLDQRFAAAGIAEAAISGRQNPWPDEPFSAAALDGFEGRIRLNAQRLTFAEGIALEGAKLDIALGADKIEVKEIAGAGLGGQFKARLQIAKAPAGAEVRGKLNFGVALEAFAAGGQPRASGPMSGFVEFAGRGMSPRAVMSALQGQGRIEFGDAKLATLWPGAVSAAADAALKSEPDKLASTVRQGLAAGLPTGDLPLGQKALALEVADGQVRAKSFAIDTNDGRATGIASLDLKALTFDSQWRLEARPPGSGKALPAVTVVYRGPVASLGTIEPRIDSGTLEQELSTRKIERDVEELERLRKLDEQRRLMEAERLRQQFEQPPPGQRPPPGVPIAPSGREPRPAPG